MTTTISDGADAGPTAGGPLAPPRLVRRPAAPPPPPPPIGQSEQVAQLHRRWAQLHGATGDPEPARSTAGDAGRGEAPTPPRIPGVRAKVRARVATAAAGVQQAERAMSGDLIRAVDALAQRIDEITTRVTDLEALVQEVVDTLSEDLVRVQVALGAPRPRTGTGPDGDPGAAPGPGRDRAG